MSNFEAFRISGEQAADVRTSQRSKYPDIFVFADRCADIIDGAVARARLQSLRQPKEMVTGLFLARATSHFHAARMLGEAGLTIESLTLSRSLFETCFVMLALAEGAVSLEELKSHDDAMRLKHANVLRNSNSYPEVERFKEVLNAFAQNVAESKEIGFYEFARRGNALAAYDGLYRHLSNHALHSTLSAVDDYLVPDVSRKYVVQYRPLLEKTSAAVLTACAGVLIAGFAAQKAGIFSDEDATVIAQTWEAYEALYSLYRPWA